MKTKFMACLFLCSLVVYAGRASAYTESTSGTSNDYFGYGAGGSGGINNSFFGKYAGDVNTGNYNTFIGFAAGYSNTTGSSNIFLGDATGFDNTTGGSNTFIGNNAGASNTTGGYNTFIGYVAGYNNTTANNNTFIGRAAGYSNTTGSSNMFLGDAAGYNNTDGYHNTFLGYSAGNRNTTGYFNTFIGRAAGYYNTDGYHNTFLGYYAGYGNTTGSTNTFLGDWTGYSNTTGGFNTFIGYLAGFDNTTGGSNIFIGDETGKSNTTGNSNTFIGNFAGYSNTAGTGNVFLGYGAGFYETGSNKLYIDNSDTSSPLIWGDFSSDRVAINGSLGVGTSSPSVEIEVAADQDAPGILATGYRDLFSAGVFDGRKARGTIASPSAVQTNDVLAVFGGYGYGASGWPTDAKKAKARMQIIAAETWTDTAQGAYINFQTTSAGSVSMFERMRITDTGDVGIGITNPTSKLTVAGTIESTSGGIKFPDASTLSSANHINADTLDGWDASAFAYSSHSHSGTDITSGTVAQTYIDALIARDLEVTIAVNAHATRTDNPHSVTAAQVGAAAAGHNHDTDYVNITGDTMTGDLIVEGSVEIDADLFVNGDTYVDSDETLKRDIQPIDSSLNKVLGIEGITYKWKRDGSASGRTHYGVIAQQVEEVLPEVVKRGDDGVRKVSYRELIPVLIEAVKEQQDIVEDQNNTISKLKEQNKQISERLAEIEKELQLKDSMAMADIK
jgi:hypothetical protein